MAGVTAGAAAVALPPAEAATAGRGVGAIGVLISVCATPAGMGSVPGVLLLTGAFGRLGAGAAGQLGKGALVGDLAFGSSSAGNGCGKESPSEASRSATNEVNSLASASTVSAGTGSALAGS